MVILKKGTKIGPYSVVEMLPSGRGGMANVYRVREKDNGHDLALKISRNDVDDVRYANALKKEVDILKLLSHPGVVRVMPLPLGSKQDPYMARAIEIPNHPWFYGMEYLEGGSLAQLISSQKALPYQLACALSVKIIDALMFIHSQGVAHLDMKPENVLMRHTVKEGAALEPVLIDFGVSARTKTQTPDGGTVWTMAPEQIRKSKGLVPPEVELSLEKMDTYSAGVVTYRMLTGNYPFDGITSKSVVTAVLNAQVQPPRIYNPALPKHFDELMMRWLEKDPDQRPSLANIREHVQYLSEGMTVFPKLPKSNGHKPFWMFWRR